MSAAPQLTSLVCAPTPGWTPADWLATLTAITHRAAQALESDLPQVLTQIVQAACRLSGADEGTVFLFDYASDELYVAARSGGSDTEPQPVRMKVGDVPIAREARRGEILIREGDVAFAPGRSANSLICAPLFAGAIQLGLLCIVSQRTRLALSEEDQKVLAALASLAALAVERFSRQRDSQQLDEWLQAFADVFKASHVSSSERDVDDLLTAIAERARRVTGADFVVLYEYLAEKKSVRLPAAVAGSLRDDRTLVENGKEIKPGPSPVFLDAAASVAERSLFVREGVLSSAALPLRIDEEAVGVLFVNYRTETQFGPDFRDHLELFAKQAALAIGNARFSLAASHQTKEARNQVVNAIGEINSAENLEQILDLIVFHAVAFLSADAGCMFLKEGESIKAAAPYGYDESDLDGLADDAVRRRIAEIAAHGETRVLSLSDTGAGELRLLRRSRSVVLVPIRTKTRALGVLLVESREPNHFDADQELLAILASQAAISISRLQLLQERAATQHGLLVSANAIAVGQIATSFIHETKNALNGMSITVHNLRDDLDREPNLKGKKDYTERLSNIQLEFQRIDELARRLQRFTQQGLRSQKEEGYFNEIVTRTLQLLGSAFRSKALKHELKLDSSLDRPAAGKGNPIVADESQIQQVLMNLILNAIAASSQRGRLVIETRNQPSQVEFRVTDYGRGISDDERRQLFTPFFTTKREGVGLGLFISKVLVEKNHGGTIEVSSVYGKGATFSVILPKVS